MKIYKVVAHGNPKSMELNPNEIKFVGEKGKALEMAKTGDVLVVYEVELVSFQNRHLMAVHMNADKPVLTEFPIWDIWNNRPKKTGRKPKQQLLIEGN